MENKNNKGRDIFFGVVALATLIVAIIGATLAYFSMTATSNEGAVNATAAVVSIEYKDGQKVTAQANELIPADFTTVVKKVYETKFVDKQDSYNDSTKNLCTDSNGKQVCSVYRFSVSSGSQINITASLKSEKNEFTNLRYAIYDRTKEVEEANEGWLIINPNKVKVVNDITINELELQTCINGAVVPVIPEDGSEPVDTAIDCFETTVAGDKGYTDFAMHSLFGYDEYGESQAILIDGTKEFDLVLFLNETNSPQNEEQGKSYQATISIDLIADYGDRVTGEIKDSDPIFQ